MGRVNQKRTFERKKDIREKKRTIERNEGHSREKRTFERKKDIREKKRTF